MLHRPRPGHRVGIRAVLLIVVAALALPATGIAIADVDAPPTLQPIPATPAEQALEVAEEVMAGESDVLSPTLALRDLALRAKQLSGEDRELAEALLARPNGGNRSDPSFARWDFREAAASRNDNGCSADPQTPVCIHWTNRGVHAPSRADSDNNNVPNWVEKTLREMENVWDFEVNTLGYRPPVTDQRASIDDDGVYFDVYLSDIGQRGYYGYCTTDDQRPRDYQFSDRAGYCVLDNDYSQREFPTNSPLENMQVTAAHEFFHAIQFAYDVGEDGWFMEAGAAWIEDEAYPNVNDNHQYLRYSQFENPLRPLDTKRGLAIYSGWGFMRFLSDRFGADVIRRSWDRADGASGGPDDYSLQALKRAIASEGGTFSDVMGDFGLALNEPDAFIDERPQLRSVSIGNFDLNRRGDSTRWRRYTLDHLSFAPLTVRPGSRLRRADRLKVTVDAPARGTHPEARVMVVRRGGDYGAPQTVRLNQRGNGSISVAFGSSDISRVVVSLGNTSADFRRCFTRTTAYSCHGGVPVDEDLRFWFKAVVR